jgi:hypothetical protein
MPSATSMPMDDADTNNDAADTDNRADPADAADAEFAAAKFAAAPPPPPPPAVAISALSDLADAYKRLLALSDEQSRHVFAGETDALLETLAKREAIAGEAAALEQSIAGLRIDWPAAAGDWSDAHRDEAEAAFRLIRDRLTELAQRDDQDAANLRARMALTKNELGRASADDRLVRRINQQYAAAAYRKGKPGVDIKR